MEDKGYTFVPHEKPFKYTEDGLKVTRGSAWTGPGCHIGCGVLLYTDENDKLVKVEGDPENPFNEGRLCARCLALPETVNHEDRLKYPMKRSRDDRGKDKWERISWEEALDTIADKLIDIRDTYGPETVAFYQGTGRDIAAWITRLCWSYGSPNYIFGMSGMSCYLPRVAGCFATTGSFWLGDYSQQFAQRYKDPRWKRPDVILLWGNNPVVSNSDGLYGHWVVDLMKMGTKFITVDPRRTWLASKSEQFCQIRPGTDAALAMGMLKVIIDEELYDHDFVDKWCYGFDELAERVREFTPEKVEHITNVPAETMKEAARLFAKADSAIVQWGLAVDTTKEALPACQAISALFEITGNIDNPGGMISPPSILYYAGGWGDEFLDPEVAKKRIGLDKYSLLNFGFQVASTDEMLKTIETKQPYEMRAAWLQTTNFLTCTAPDPHRTIKAFRNLDFIVGVDLFMTPTLMALADIVLPAATYAERDGLRVGDGVQRGEAINKVTQVGEAKSDMEINLLLGKRLRPEAWPWDNVRDMFSYILEDAGVGMNFDELQEHAPAYIPFEYYKYKKGLLRADGKPGFETPTGRIELWSNFYNNAGLDPLPYFEEPSPGPLSTPELLDEYPLVLTTGARDFTIFHSESRQIEHLRAVHPDPIVQVNPATCRTYGISEGDWVWIENDRGRCKRKVEETLIVDENTISTDHAWWFPEGDPENLYDVFDLNINNLFQYIPGKSGFGCNYKTLLCKIYKA
ncbi:MAG: molybdopterin-dependent oxidoreductase [Coriobacteriia bacterium]|nr:molybdopterin-dependent oxidoreductase [Coriobacteriia bacterium]